MYLDQAEKEREEYQKAKEGKDTLITETVSGCLAFGTEKA